MHGPPGVVLRVVRSADWQKQLLYIACDATGADGGRQELAACMSVVHWRAQAGNVEDAANGRMDCAKAEVRRIAEKRMRSMGSIVIAIAVILDVGCSFESECGPMRDLRQCPEWVLCCQQCVIHRAVCSGGCY